jgi:hypothetical protein
MAFNFIPTSLEDLEEIKDFERYSEIKMVFTRLKHLMPNPIAIDKGKPSHIKVARAIAHQVNIKDFSSDILKVSFGDGSRGNRGQNNRGLVFEQDYANSFKLWLSGKTTEYDDSFSTILQNNRNANTLCFIDGSLNTKRPLTISDQYIGPEGGFVNIGATISDVSFGNEEKRTHYISLKYGSQTSFYNCGIKKFIKDRDVIDGTISNSGIQLLTMFGIHPSKFCNAFTKKYTISSPSVNTYDIISKYKLVEFIKSVIGFGYWKVHKQNNMTNTEEMSKHIVEDYSEVIDCNVHYGGKTGTGKKVEAEVITKKYTLNFNFRSTSGSGYLTHLICGFKENDNGR